MEQKIVVHRKDGTIHKGVTQDFDPEGEVFHFLPAEGGGIPMRMRIDSPLGGKRLGLPRMPDKTP